MDQVLNALRSSSCLRRLVLRGFYPWADFFSMWSQAPQEALSEPQDSSPIDLPYLETLIMRIGCVLNFLPSVMAASGSFVQDTSPRQLPSYAIRSGIKF